MLLVLRSYISIGCFFFFFKQKTAYEMRISDWSSDVCSSDLSVAGFQKEGLPRPAAIGVFCASLGKLADGDSAVLSGPLNGARPAPRSEIGRASCRERVCQYV